MGHRHVNEPATRNASPNVSIYATVAVASLRLQETSGLSRAAPILAGRVFFEEQALELLAASIGPKFATANYST